MFNLLELLQKQTFKLKMKHLDVNFYFFQGCMYFFKVVLGGTCVKIFGDLWPKESRAIHCGPICVPELGYWYDVTSHMWLVRSWHVASVIKEFNLNLF